MWPSQHWRYIPVHELCDSFGPQKSRGIHAFTNHEIFILFINDFPSCLSNAACNIFADDNMVYVNGKSIAKFETLLQKSVDESVKRLRMNKLNIDKCHVMLKGHAQV